MATTTDLRRPATDHDVMITPPVVSVTSPACKRCGLVLLVSQLLMIGIAYYSRDSIWTILDHNHYRPTTDPRLNFYVGSRHVSIQNLNNHSHGEFVEHSSDDLNTIWKMESISNSTRIKIAIGLGITTRKSRFDGRNYEQAFPFYHSLLKSFCMTCSSGYEYHFFLAYDYNDPLMSNRSFLEGFQREFLNFVNINCLAKSGYHIHFVKCDHTRRPAWAQNDAMMEAYISGMDYFYRINDDTLMKSKNWSPKFIDALNAMDPPLVGVVGPKHRGGNTHILTYDFTHRTHLEIHGFYYPRTFKDWYGDRWITDVYKPGRSSKLETVILVHTMETGQRYQNTRLAKSNILGQIDQDKEKVTRYVAMKEKGFFSPDPEKVIAMSLAQNESASLWGVIRNAQLAPIIFPGWTVRVYVPGAHSANSSHSVLGIPANVLRVLSQLGAQIVTVDSSIKVPPISWGYLVADVPSVKLFLVRNPTERLNERDAATVNDWLAKDSENKMAIHATRDHPKYEHGVLMHGQLGVKSEQLADLLGGESMGKLLISFTANMTYDSSMSSQSHLIQQFLQTVLLHKIKDGVVWHDSIRCNDTDTRNVLPFPTLKKNDQAFIGQTFDAHELPKSKEDAKKALLERNANCELPP